MVKFSRWLLPLFGAALFGSGQVWAGFEEDFEAKTWEEVAVRLPSPPKKENLVPFYVGPVTEHLFFVDINSLTVGSDGVVRYTLVVRTSGGATNVSYEGMRCETRERRPYAFGSENGAWSKTRYAEWVKVREGGANRHYAALFVDHFCPGGVIVAGEAAVQRSLRQGGERPIVIPGR